MLKITVAYLSFAALASCGIHNNEICVSNKYVHPCHEDNFQDHFDLNISLPMDSNEFTKTLDGKDISYSLRERDVFRYDYSREFGESIKYSISISGKSIKRVAVRYVAFINYEEDVVLIENNFGYKSF